MLFYKYITNIKVIAFIILLLCGESKAQSYSFDYYGLNANIPSEHTTTIYQSKYGLMWFGFDQGGRVYDSYTFSDLKIQDNPFFHEAIHSFCETKSDYYFNTLDNLYEGKGHFFKKIPFPSEAVNHHLSRIFSFGDTVYALTSKGLYKLKSGHFTKVVTHTAIDSLPLYKFMLDRKNNLWLITQKGQLHIFNLDKKEEVSASFLPNAAFINEPVSDVTEANNNTYYLALKNGVVYSINNKQINRIKFNLNGKEPERILSLQFERSSNTLWAAAYNQGLIKYSNGHSELISTSNGLRYLDIISIFCDSEENIWLATATHGVIKYKKNGITNFNVPGGSVETILKDTIHKQFLILSRGVISILKDHRLLTLQAKPDSGICSLNEAEDGLFAIGYANGKMRWIKHNQIQPETIELLKEPYEISNIKLFHGKLLFSDDAGGLYMHHLSHAITTKLKVPFKANVTCLKKTKKGDTLWIGTEDGLFLLDTSFQIRKLKLPGLHDFKDVSITGIGLQKQYLFVSTNCMGVFSYNLNSKTTKHLTTKEGIASDHILNLEVIDTNRIVISTAGLINVIDWKDKNIGIDYYTPENHYQEFEFQTNSMARSFNGAEIIAGSNTGLLLFNNLLNQRFISPKVLVNEILVNGQEIDRIQNGSSFDKNGLPQYLTLKSDDENITIHYSGIKYSTNEPIQYAYRVNSEKDDAWIQLGEGGELFIQDLPTGNINIDIKAKGQSSNWGESVRLSFYKRPPFWRTRFFGFLVMSICLVLFASFFRYNQRFKKELINEETSSPINLQTARLMLFFAAFFVPFAETIYSLINDVFDEKFGFMIVIGTGLAVSGVFTFISRVVQENIKTVILINFAIIIFAYSTHAYLTHISPYSVVSLTVCITVSTLIIDQTRKYIYFAALTIIIITLLALLTPSPEYNTVLFILAIVTTLFVSFISILIKLNVNQRLIFADTVMNKGNSLIIASNANGQVIFVNQALTRLVGYSEKDILGEGWWMIQNDKEKTHSVKQSILDGTLPKTRLALVKGKEDKHYWVQWQNNRLDNGVTVSIGNDVTDKQEYEKRFSHIVENAKDIIYVTDTEGFFTYVNDIAVNVTGYSKAELLKKNFKDLIKPNFRKKVALFYGQQLKSEEQQSYLEFPIISKSGNIIWVGQQVMFLRDSISKVFTGTQAICRDITIRVETEDKLRIANNDLKMLNEIKEIILRNAEDQDLLAEGVLKKLHSNRRSNECFSLGFLTKDGVVKQYGIHPLKSNILRATYSLSEHSLRSLEISPPRLIQQSEEFPEYLKQDSLLFHNKNHVLSIPVKNGYKVFGYLNLFAEDHTPYTTDYLSVLDDVVSYLSTNLNQQEQKQIISAKNEEIRLYLTKLENINNELQYENILKENVIYAKDIDDVCNRLLTHIISTTVKSYCYSFNILDMEQENLLIYQGFKDKGFKRYSIELTETMKKLIFESKSLLYFYDPDSRVNDTLRLFKQPIDGLTCALLAPIQTLTNRYGFMGVYTASPELYDNEDLRKTEAIAEILSSFVSQYYAKQAINTRNIQIQKYSNQLEYINTNLEEQNRIKQLIISVKERDVFFHRLLLMLISQSRYAQGYTINIFNKKSNDITVYSIRRHNTISFKETIGATPLQIGMLEKLDERIISFPDNDFLAIYDLLHVFKQPCINARTMMFKTISNTESVIGLICTYSYLESIYEEADVKYLVDLASSLQNFISRDEQSHIIAAKNEEIEKNSKRLELLNEARELLINNTDLTDLYKNLIELLFKRIDNIHRISFLIFNQGGETGQLYYMDSMSLSVENKQINTSQLPTLPYFEANKEYDLPDLENKMDLTDDDRHWLNVKMRSVYCVPVFVNGSLFGAINMLSRNWDNFAEQKPIIRQLKESVSLIIEQILYKDIISQKNKDINDNIAYAKRIQTAIMPSPLTLKQLLPKSILFFEQRDNLGGDFYWFQKVNQSLILTIADCTGHGVSGSLLTILSSNSIQQAVTEKGFTDPAHILEYLNISIRNALNQTNSETEILDGLDISCVNFDPENRLLLYSGAMHNLYIVRDNEVIELRGNRFPIGSFQISNSNHFTTHIMAMKPGDLVISTTDGYIDQFGNQTNKRFGRLKFKDLLLELAPLTPENREKHIKQAHLNWKGNNPQTDDICLMCFEVE